MKNKQLGLFHGITIKQAEFKVDDIVTIKTPDDKMNMIGTIISISPSNEFAKIALSNKVELLIEMQYLKPFQNPDNIS